MLLITQVMTEAYNLDHIASVRAEYAPTQGAYMIEAVMAGPATEKTVYLAEYETRQEAEAELFNLLTAVKDRKEIYFCR